MIIIIIRLFVMGDIMVTVVFLYNDFLYSTTIDYNEEISFGSNKKDDVKIKDFDKESIKVKFKDSKISVNAKKAYDVMVDDMPFNSFVDFEDGSRIFVGEHYSESAITLKLPYNGIVNFGRSSKNNVVIAKPFISSKHFVMRCESGNVHIEDLNSTNGLYLNGKKVEKALMKSGDFIQIFSVVITLKNGVLYFSNVDDKLTINEIKSEYDISNVSRANNDNALIYKRSPRTRAKMPNEELVLAAPPTKATKQRKSRGMFSAIAGSGAMMAAGMLGGVASPALIAARAAGLVSPIASIASNKGMNKDNKREYEQYELKRREKYGDYIDDQKAKIGKIADIQREIVTGENPSPKDCSSILFNLTKNLWERSPSDSDYLKVRLGMGYADLCVPIKAPHDQNGIQLEDDEVKELTGQIIEETRIVDNIPSCISLFDSNTIGFIGDRQKNIRIVKNLLIELTALHCFDDVKIIGIFDEEERKVWEPIRWLPHVSAEKNGLRFLAFDSDDTHSICESMDELIKRRKSELKSYQSNKVEPPKPFYIFIFGSKELVKKEEIMSNLFDNNPAIGVTSLFLFDDLYELPLDCKFIVDANNGPCFYEKNEFNNKFYFTIDESLSNEEFDLFARRMSAIELDGFAVKKPLPDGLSFLEGYNVETVEELNVLERWNSNTTAGSMAAPIGVLEGEKPFYFDIHSNHHGSHALAAGTTGSGKSELIQTWILSMAINYHPDEVNFVIIDYKGGGMADLMEPLPHVTGKITNISSNIYRSLTALKAEIKRREEIFAKYNVNSLGKYIALYKSGIADKPIPHLIIVCDEFAELKQNEPDFMRDLVSVARVGRSLGIHMLLATQNPSGIVDDQIDSNTKSRLCLKVNNVANSREMLKRPDAAYVTQPGRCFIRVGEDEYFDEFQSYWSGAKYTGNSKEKVVENKIKIIETNGNKFAVKKKKLEGNNNSVDELHAIVSHVVKVAEENNIERLPGPWLPELPTSFDLLGLCAVEPKWPQIPVGIFDIPSKQKQGALMMNFAEDGHYGIYGAPGTGKTTLLKTMIMSACKTYAPSDICFYILDFGGWSLSVFNDMPHVGGIALDGEDEKFQKFETLITEEINERKKVFLKNSVSSLSAYRESVDDSLPAIVIAIDNFSALFEAYPDMETLFNMIATTGTTYGIYLVYTSSTVSGVKYKIMQNVKGTIAFELTDKGDYSSLVGRLEDVPVPNLPGRALFKSTKPIEFQVALYAEGNDDKERTENVRKVAKELRANWTGDLPKAIPVMPEELSFDDLACSYNEPTKIPVGLSYANVTPMFIDLSDSYSMMIAGSPNSGKSTQLKNITELILSKDNQKVFVFDSEDSPISSLSSSVYRYAKTSDDATVSSMIVEIIDELNARKKSENSASELICVVIDDIKTFVEDVSDESLASMERICRLAKQLGIIVIVAGRTSDLLKYSQIESLTRTVFLNQRGFVLDGTPAEHNYFNNNLKYNEVDVAAGEGNGYAFIDGQCIKIKLAK